MDLAGGVQANMLLVSQLRAIFAAFTAGEGILQERRNAHLKPLQTYEAETERQSLLPCAYYAIKFWRNDVTDQSQSVLEADQ